MPDSVFHDQAMQTATVRTQAIVRKAMDIAIASGYNAPADPAFVGAVIGALNGQYLAALAVARPIARADGAPETAAGK